MPGKRIQPLADSIRAATATIAWADKTMDAAQAAHRENATQPIMVAATILARMIKSHRAIRQMVDKGFPAEAAIIGLTQLELRTDLQMIGRDPETRALRWLEHENEAKAPWPVAGKLNEIYGDAGLELEKEFQFWMFRRLSMFKHGNPVPIGSAFTVRMQANGIKVSSQPLHDDMEQESGAMACYLATFQLIDATESTRDSLFRLDAGVQPPIPAGVTLALEIRRRFRETHDGLVAAAPAS